jgi:hypothetical protein
VVPETVKWDEGNWCCRLFPVVVNVEKGGGTVYSVLSYRMIFCDPARINDTCFKMQSTTSITLLTVGVA